MPLSRAAALLALVAAVGVAAGEAPSPAPNARPSGPEEPLQSCLAFYPPSSIERREQGNVTVEYDIAEDGTTRAAQILVSAGENLNSAALACVGSWHLVPVLKDNAPIYSAGHKTTIQFWIMPHVPAEMATLPPDLAAKWQSGPRAFAYNASIAPSRMVGRTHDCTSYYPRRAMMDESGWVLVGYDVEADGEITNVSLLWPSGFADLDAAALACVGKQWRNTPATKDGAPIRSPGHQAVVTFFVH